MSKNTSRPRALRSQGGATLLITMIFLVVLMLIVVSAIKVTNVNTKIVGNMQIQKEAEAAAQQAIETVISTDFTKLPTTTTMPVDISDSGQTGSTYSVTVPAPTCISVKPIKLSELDAGNADDLPCYASGAAQNTGIVGSAATGASLCSNSNWEISATAAAPSVAATQSTTTTHQGVATRVALGTAC
jgi:Tfp pilus assembly protein PilX